MISGTGGAGGATATPIFRLGAMHTRDSLSISILARCRVKAAPKITGSLSYVMELLFITAICSLAHMYT